MVNDDLLTAAQVSDRLNLPIATLNYWRQVKEGPQWFKLGRRKVMYRATDVQAWLDAQYAASTAPSLAVAR